MRLKTFLPVFALAVVTACGTDASTLSYATLTGAFSAALTGTAQAPQQGSVTISFTQSRDSLGGTFTATATDVAAGGLRLTTTGTITGGMASGDNPGLSLTLHVAACPNYSATYTGQYNSATKQVQLSGAFEFFGPTGCDVAYSFPQSVTMNP